MTRTSLRTEIFAGLTTFMTMSYIIFANPAILAQAGVPVAGATTATCLGAAIATALMAWATDYPFALASGMGLNAFLAFTVCQGMGVDWEIGMAVVVLEGLLIALLVLLGLRRWVMDALPLPLKHAIGVGIGLFIALIGFKMGGLVTAAPGTFVRLGDLGAPEAVVTIAGLLVTVTCLAWRVPGALLIGIAAGALLADAGFGMAKLEGVVAPPNFSTVWKFWRGLDVAMSLRLLPVLFAFAMSDFFDTMGTVIGVGAQAGFVDRKGGMPRLTRVLFVDGIAASLGGILGCSSITTYVESASGVAAGGRRAVTGYVVAALFLLAIFLSPLAAAVPSCAVAPALIVVGFFMMQGVARIAWGRLEEGLPAFLTIVLMPFTFNIATGIGWGVLAAVAIPAVRGRWREIHPMLWLTAAVFAISFSPLVPR
jgi:AGZA family xanthine/uracil permease-like MFS transporter